MGGKGSENQRQMLAQSQVDDTKNNYKQVLGNQNDFTITRSKSLHDMNAFKEKKMRESAPFFKDTKVQTCSHIVVKNGQAVAVAFPLEKTGWRHPNSYVNTVKSSEVESWASQTFKQRQNLHAGMLKKPLEPYHPLAQRSRLPQPTIVMPYKNSSQIVIGDRSSVDRRQFKTVNQLMQLKPNYNEIVISNGGINASKTKWIHNQQNKQ